MLENLPLLLVRIAVPVLLLGVPVLFLTGWYRHVGARRLRACFNGIDVRASPEPNDVSVVYHTYRGLLLYGLQDEHRFFTSPDDSRRLLKRLLRFNLTWGLLTPGMVFVPFLAIGNYKGQLRSIRQQEQSNSADSINANA